MSDKASRSGIAWTGRLREGLEVERIPKKPTYKLCHFAPRGGGAKWQSSEKKESLESWVLSKIESRTKSTPFL